MNTDSPVTEQRAPEQLSLPLQVPAAPARTARGTAGSGVRHAGGPGVVVPLKFRVSEATARRGLQHVAELRALLNERQAAREAARTQRPSAA